MAAPRFIHSLWLILAVTAHAQTTTVTQTTKTTVKATVPSIEAKDMRAAVTNYLTQNTKEGLVSLKAWQGEQKQDLKLKFDRLLDSVVTLDPANWIVTGNFSDKSGRPYEIDFGVTPRADGKAMVVPDKI